MAHGSLLVGLFGKNAGAVEFEPYVHFEGWRVFEPQSSPASSLELVRKSTLFRTWSWVDVFFFNHEGGRRDRGGLSMKHGLNMHVFRTLYFRQVDVKMPELGAFVPQEKETKLSLPVAS